MMVTLEDLRRQTEGTASGRLQFALSIWSISKPTYDEWVALIEDAVSHFLAEIASRRHNFHDIGEDPLTSILVLLLRAVGLRASSAVVNGNCDLSIEYDSYRWLGEAKIGDDVGKIYGGYLQLTSRYTTGYPEQNAGGILLYCVKSQALAALEGWKAALREAVPAANVTDGEHPLKFRSSDTCQSTGLPLRLVHMAMALKFEPQENIGKLTPAARGKARNAKAKAKLKGK
ncbi:hypothetical protein [Luteimonas sp. R10]|uniref:hypothetical protein n=1 Tax=Luteimonas sp. R10 TaxID=3108176 RepID=UPI00308F5671|nr:hypothetical protein U3649_03395 [Luteimonas sp. R10]